VLRDPHSVPPRKALNVCWIIHVGIPRAKFKSVDEVASLFGAELTVIGASNPSVIRAFGPAWAVSDVGLGLRGGGCSCAVFRDLGSMPTLDQQRATEERRLRRRGWSAERIAKRLSAVGDSTAPSNRFKLSREFAAGMARLIHRFGVVEILAHAYRGSFEHEDVGTFERGRITMTELANAHGAFHGERLIEVVA
jgi:hypothetical protein